MDQVDIRNVIQRSIARFNQNRRGPRPLIFVTMPPNMPRVPWSDGALEKIVSRFLYESFLSGNPDNVVEVALRRCRELKDLNEFVGVRPDYWLQLRVSGRGLKCDERRIEDLCAAAAHRCEEWVGADHSETHLGIFSAQQYTAAKIVFGLESKRDVLRCDLLLPVFENAALYPRVPAKSTGCAAV